MNPDVKRLLEIAEEDLGAAKELFKNKKFRTCAFHYQQAVEKFLKAYLLKKEDRYPFTHSIAFLIKSCIKVDKSFEYLFEINPQELSKYYTTTRYLPLMEITEEDAKESIEIAEKVREFVLKKFELKEE